MAMYQARDTFVAELKEGSQRLVTKGEAFHESHELVKLDAGSGVLFARMDTGEDEAAPKGRAPRAKALWRRRRRVTGCGSISRR